MKLAQKFVTGTALVGMLGAVAAFTGCSSSDSDDNNTSAVGQPPAKPDAPATTSTTVRTFAVNSVDLGAANGTAWRKIGYNLDGKSSTGSSTDVCQARDPLANPHQDGDNGIDNSFGSQILPKVLNIAPDAQNLANTALTNGTFTIMVQATGLEGAGDATGIKGQLFAGGRFNPDDETARPTFTTSDDWPVIGSLLNNATDVNSGSKITFNDGYVSNGTFVSGQNLSVSLSLNFNSFALSLNIRNAVITFKPNGETAASGIIAGTLLASELADNIRNLAPQISAELCDGAAVDALVDNILAAADSLSDGSQDAGKPCDAISIGLGFTAKQIGNPTRVAQVSDEPATNLCNGGDAGADAAN